MSPLNQKKEKRQEDEKLKREAERLSKEELERRRVEEQEAKKEKRMKKQRNEVTIWEKSYRHGFILMRVELKKRLKIY